MLFGSIDPPHQPPLKPPPPTINLDGGDDYPPHKRPPNKGHLLRRGWGGLLLKGGEITLTRT